MFKTASKLAKTIYCFLVIALNVIFQKMSNKFGSNYKTLNKLINYWVGSQYELPVTVFQAKAAEHEATSSDTSLEMEVQKPYEQTTPAFLKNHPLSQKCAVSAESTLVLGSSETQNKQQSDFLNKQTRDFNADYQRMLYIKKRSMSGIDLKLTDYNTLNSQYIVRKFVDWQQKNGSESFVLPQTPLPQELDDATICQFMIPSTNPLILSKLSNLPKSKPSKHRRHRSFQPTKLSTIFENLAY